MALVVLGGASGMADVKGTEVVTVGLQPGLPG